MSGFGTGLANGINAAQNIRRTDLAEANAKNRGGGRGGVSIPKSVDSGRRIDRTRERPKTYYGRKVPESSEAAAGAYGGEKTVDNYKETAVNDYNNAVTSMVTGDYTPLVDYINNYGNKNVNVSDIKKNEDGSISFISGATGGGTIKQGGKVIKEITERPGSEMKFKDNRDLYVQIVSQMKPGGEAKIPATKDVSGGMGLGTEPGTGPGASAWKGADLRAFIDDVDTLVYRDAIAKKAATMGLDPKAEEAWMAEFMTVDDKGNLKVNRDRFVRDLSEKEKSKLDMQLTLGQQHVTEGNLPSMAAQRATAGDDIAPIPKTPQKPTSQELYSNFIAKIPATPEGALSWVKSIKKAGEEGGGTPEEFLRERERVRQINPDLYREILKLERGSQPVTGGMVNPG